MVRVPFILLLAPHRKGSHMCFLLPGQGSALEVSLIASSEGAAMRGAVGCRGLEARLWSPAPWVKILAPLLPCLTAWLRASHLSSLCLCFLICKRGMMTIIGAATSEDVISSTWTTSIYKTRKWKSTYNRQQIHGCLRMPGKVRREMDLFIILTVVKMILRPTVGPLHPQLPPLKIQSAGFKNI